MEHINKYINIREYENIYYDTEKYKTIASAIDSVFLS